jgi:multisubunit Na+/H+ antiporter MnhB subunit
MFVLLLRGRFGAIIALRLCLLSIALTIVLFRSSNLGLQLAAIAAFLVGSFLILAHMDRNKEKLIFSSHVNRQFAYPSTPKKEKWIACYQWTLVILFFYGGLLVALSGMDEIAHPTGVIAVGFFLGCFSMIDVIHRLFRKQDH